MQSFIALFILVFMLVAAPLASYVPLAALAGVLAVIAWRMIERHAILTLVRTSKGDAIALFATLLLTVFRDLTEGIVAGVAIGALSFIHRMSEATALNAHEPIVERDRPDAPPETREDYAPTSAGERGVGIYRVRGALFFGSAASLAIALDRVIDGRRALILDFSEASLVDSTGANAIRSFTQTARSKHVAVRISGASPAVRRALETGGLAPAAALFHETIAAALASLK